MLTRPDYQIDHESLANALLRYEQDRCVCPALITLSIYPNTVTDNSQPGPPTHPLRTERA
jgi:hypothetical protein